MSSARKAHKVLFIELNEITWSVADRLLAEGKLPMIERLRREGAWAAPEAMERPPFLDPWISWVTVHTGVDRSVHGASVLEQDADTIHAKRTWEYALDAGKTIGVFGSIGAYPPKPVPGFMVPGPFAPGPETFPPFLEPAQHLNRRYTQVHHKNAEESGPFEMAKLGIELLKLGLKPATCATIVAQLVRERVTPHKHWMRVALQPLVNFDFFSSLYEKYRPDFATWHSNHAAHYMHHYWRAWDDSGFPSQATEEEKRKFGGAVEHGYRVADDLIGRFMNMVDDDTVLVVCSALGQRPYHNDLYPEGKVCVKFKDVRRVLDLVGAVGVADVVPVMDPQWNVKIPDAAERARVKAALLAVRREGGPTPNALSVEETGEILTVTPMGLAKMDPGVRYHFPAVQGRAEQSFGFDELFRGYGDTPKEGMHDTKSMLLLWGPGIVPGTHIESTTNMDIAPTVLALMGIDVPSSIMGRVLCEAWGEKPQPRDSAPIADRNQVAAAAAS